MGKHPALLLVRGLLHLARTGGLHGGALAVSLRLIDWYQGTVSAGTRRCPTGRNGTRASCSRYGRRVVERYGVLLGWWLALARMRQCTAMAVDGGAEATCMDMVIGLCDPCGCAE